MHVPEENLLRYRKLAGLARVLESIGNRRSGRGDYTGAVKAWAAASRTRELANQLRVPGKGEVDGRDS